jgi:predicted cupin superfamily sugar epimerase
VGCTVAPGFDFEDFELAKKQFMLEKFPDHMQLWKEMCLD